MTLDPILILKRAASLGLKLGIDDDGISLTVRPFSQCPHDFCEVLREHKTKLLELLSAGNVSYTSDELQILNKQECEAPFTTDELLTLHSIKKLFNAKITGTDRRWREKAPVPVHAQLNFL